MKIECNETSIGLKSHCLEIYGTLYLFNIDLCLKHSGHAKKDCVCVCVCV